VTGRPLRVLVVDDDFAVAAIHRRCVESVPGFAVAGVAHQGTECLRLVDELSPDLLLLDVYLPDMSGIEVLRELRARPSGKDVDVMAVTASREVETVRAAMSGGVVQYLIKPFTLATLNERLLSYAAQRRELQRLSDDAGTVRDQAQVDRLLTPPTPRDVAALPKGLSARTLDLVAQCLRDAGRELSSGEAAELCGMSRVSARRYLEHLAGQGLAHVRPRYGSAGRPELGYRWVGSPPRQ
jgi:two-component system CitB family response regulator